MQSGRCTEPSRLSILCACRKRAPKAKRSCIPGWREPSFTRLQLRFLRVPPSNTQRACLFFCRAFSPSDGERAATVLGKWFFTALKLSLESGAPQGRALGCHPCTAGEAGSSHGSSASSRMEEEGFHLPCFPPFEDMGSAGSAASPSMFLPSDFLGCTSLAGTRGLTRSHPGEHPPWLSQAAKRGWCWGAGGTVSVNCG